jgi:4-hydroxy-2-oxoglutarate aldolase
MTRFSGTFTPIVTPFDRDDAVDEVAMARNVRRWMKTSLDGLVVLGSNGEAAQLDDDEADRVVELVRSDVPRDRVLIAGTGRESTRGTIAATRRAAAQGVDAVLVRTPAFFKSQMTAEILERHYLEVAEASPVPVLLYNVTMFTGVNLPVESVARLAEHANIVGMKESGSDIGQIAELVAQTSDDFVLLAGSATTFFHALCAGCAGAVLALAALVPDDCGRMRALVADGHVDEARQLQHRLAPLARSVGAVHGVPGLKSALDSLGFTGGPPRPPLRPVTPHVAALIRGQLDALASPSPGSTSLGMQGPVPARI